MKAFYHQDKQQWITGEVCLDNGCMAFVDEDRAIIFMLPPEEFMDLVDSGEIIPEVLGHPTDINTTLTSISK